MIRAVQRVCSTNYSLRNHRVYFQAHLSSTYGDSTEKKIPGSEEERILRPPTGTRDFDPESHRFKSWLFSKWRSAAKMHGFVEYDAPIVEYEQLFTRKSGEDVTKQMYNLQDRDGNRLSLRPEMTPSLARMVLAKKETLQLPIKWFSIPQCWRYESTTVGRRREHYQWNMDIWGVAGVEAEAELLSAAITALRHTGLSSSDVVFKINSRKILNELMKLLGIPVALWTPTFLAMDKADKLPRAALLAELLSTGLSAPVAEELIVSLQAKDVEYFAAKLGRDSEGVADVLRLQQLLRMYGLQDWVVFDASVVRGLAYYTGIVFEAFDRQGALRAVCGGGRYDSLLSTMFEGATPVPAVGFGFGDAVLEELLKLKGLVSALTKSHSVDVVLYTMDSVLRGQATELANTLRDANVSVDYIIEDKWKPKHAFQRGDKMGANYVLMLAMSEHKKGEAVLKDLRNRTQHTFRYEDIGQQIEAILGNSVARVG